jgi:hypothetical protein
VQNRFGRFFFLSTKRLLFPFSILCFKYRSNCISERENLTPEQRQELIETVNFTLLNEETLQGALSAAVVPATCVAKGAIALCTRLRADLETARVTLQRQDDELKRLKTAVKRGKTIGTPIMTSSTSSLRDTSFGSVNGARDSDLGKSSILIMKRVILRFCASHLNCLHHKRNQNPHLGEIHSDG